MNTIPYPEPTMCVTCGKIIDYVWKDNITPIMTCKVCNP